MGEEYVNVQSTVATGEVPHHASEKLEGARRRYNAPSTMMGSFERMLATNWDGEVAHGHVQLSV